MDTGADIHVRDLRRFRLTLPQAAQVLNMDLVAVRKTVDRGWLQPRYVRLNGRSIRALDGVDIVCLIINRSIVPNIRKRVYVELKHWPDDRPLRGTVAVQIDDPKGSRIVDVPLDRSVREAMAGLAAFEQSQHEVDDHGRIRGTTVEAHRIAALIEGGMQGEEVLRDYPNLTKTQLDSAIAYARAHPKQGRPFPPRTVKSVLRQGRGGLAHVFAAARDAE